MIERKFVADKIKEFQIQEFIETTLKKVGHSHTKLVKTPLGEKIIIYASRPGLIVGRKGDNIKRLTKTLKKKFNLENPQIEISEIENPSLDPKIVAEKIANSLERFGTSKFKAIGHKTMSDVMNSGALGVEIVISGKIPSARAKSWRFYQGYLKKCGEVAISGVQHAYTQAQLKTGVIGVKISIMPPTVKLPDALRIHDAVETIQPKQAEPQKEQPVKKSKEKETREPKESKEAKETKTRSAKPEDNQPAEESS